jgi:hypothetical protein
MNHGEELVYWYLRLNGFFPLSNFVVHKSSQVAGCLAVPAGPGPDRSDGDQPREFFRSAGDQSSGAALEQLGRKKRRAAYKEKRPSAFNGWGSFDFVEIYKC